MNENENIVVETKTNFQAKKGQCKESTRVQCSKDEIEKHCCRWNYVHLSMNCMS